MGVEVADERPYPIAPRGRDGVRVYDFGLTYPGAGDLDAGGVRESFQDTFVRTWRAMSRTTPTTGSSSAARRAGARSPSSARSAVPAAGADHLQRQVREQALVSPGDRAAARGLVPGALRPAPHRPPLRRRRSPSGSRRRSTPSRASTRTRSCGCLGVIRAVLRTNYFKTGLTEARATRLQARPVRSFASHCRGPPWPRDLSCTAEAHRGRAPARRGGGARRDPLVGQARGLPHRGVGLDEGADGEERGDRHRRAKGGGSWSSGRRRGRGAPRGGCGLLPDLHPRDADRPTTSTAARSCRPRTGPLRRRRSAPVVAADKGTATSRTSPTGSRWRRPAR